jgi:nucleoside-diphosphate-sugar epimerase
MGRPARLLPVPPALLSAMAALAGRKGWMQRLAGNLTVDVSASKAILGWRPRISLDEGLARAVVDARASDIP